MKRVKLEEVKKGDKFRFLNESPYIIRTAQKVGKIEVYAPIGKSDIPAIFHKGHGSEVWLYDRWNII